jgi:uncharacterized protein
MLELRPVCENCRAMLLPDATNAMICSFECTFCKNCVDTVLENVCPNCGGGFCPRPIRPSHNWKNNNCVARYSAQEKIHYKPVDAKGHRDFAAGIKDIPIEKR